MRFDSALHHLAMILAAGMGIVGFGLIYDGLADHAVPYLTTGIPLLMLGLWWSGRDLARSTAAARRRRLLRAPHAEPPCRPT